MSTLSRRTFLKGTLAAGTGAGRRGLTAVGWAARTGGGAGPGLRSLPGNHGAGGVPEPHHTGCWYPVIHGGTSQYARPMVEICHAARRVVPYGS